MDSTPDATPKDHRRHLLVFHRGSSWMHELPEHGSILIGRAEDADLQIDAQAISRRHAVIAVRGDAMTISDLGSHNGTLVNKQPITGEHRLESGDTIAIHDTVIVVHCAKPALPAATVLDHAAFQLRLECELERAVRHERSFSLLVLLWGSPVADPGAVERVLGAELRRIDAAMWVSPASVRVMLAEATHREAEAFAARMRDALDPSIRIGHVECPGDGADLDELIATAELAAAGSEVGATTHTTRKHQTMTIGGQRIIIAEPSVIRLYALVERLAPTDIPLQIYGETGTGKELVATAVHMLSRRRDRPLVSLNCAAIPESLVESELFGYEKGAFSGAVTTKLGQLEAAHKSTLFLDEIGELPLAAQAKLLRVLENRKLTRLGDVREREVDVRIVVATNRALEQEVEAGRFRQDLYFRLHGAQLVVPPLRDRPKEIPLLATLFLDEACAQHGRSPMQLADSARDVLLAHPWPGNVRELRNLMRYVAAAHHDPVLRAEHLHDQLNRRSPAQDAPVAFRPLADEIRDLEIARIKAALEATAGNQTRAAALLSVPIRTFSEKVKQYGIPANRRRGPTDE